MNKKRTALLLVLMLILSLCFAIPASAATTVADWSKSVVRIYTEVDGGASVGTGFYVGQKDGKDIFVTNRHVVTDDDFNIAKRVYILTDDNSASWIYTFYQYKNSSGNWLNSAPTSSYPEPGLGYFSDTNVDTSRTISCDVLYTTYSEDDPDIAIIQASRNIEGLEPLPLVSPKDVNVGDTVYALGFPGASDTAATVFDKEAYEYYTSILVNGSTYSVYTRDYIKALKATPEALTVTKGAISRITTYSNTARNSIDVVQTDTAFSSGNSGGPLMTDKGAVVGINTFSVTSGGTEIRYATSIDYAVTQLKALGVDFNMFSDGMAAWLIILIIVGAAIAVIAVVIVVIVVVTGNQKKAPAPVSQPVAAPQYESGDSGPRLQCMMGTFAGRRFAIGSAVRIGRDPSRNDLVYPANVMGISGVHCVVSVSGGRVLLQDLGSTYGTYIGNGRRLAANETVQLNIGDRFWLGSEKEVFMISAKGGY